MSTATGVYALVWFLGIPVLIGALAAGTVYGGWAIIRWLRARRDAPERGPRSSDGDPFRA